MKRLAVAALLAMGLALTPVAASGTADPRPIVFGDSLTVDTLDNLHAMPGELYTWAAPGWSMYHFETLVAAAAEQRRPVVVLALGTNDSIWSSVSVASWHRSLARLRDANVCVVYLRAYRSPLLTEQMVAFLDSLDTMAQSYNAHVLDWHGVAATMPERHIDGVRHDSVLRAWYAYVLWLASHHIC